MHLPFAVYHGVFRPIKDRSDTKILCAERSALHIGFLFQVNKSDGCLFFNAYKPVIASLLMRSETKIGQLSCQDTLPCSICCKQALSGGVLACTCYDKKVSLRCGAFFTFLRNVLTLVQSYDKIIYVI